MRTIHASAQGLKFSKIHLLHLCILAASAILLLRLSVPEGYLFGSETDWFCQHVTIADYMRQHFYATGEFLPDWSGLGSGTNFYALSYYGFLRPDVLLSFFLPHVSMTVILQTYAIAGIILGALLLYLWLCRSNIKSRFCLIAGLLYLSSNCMFQAHRQIMFVNYLPFLLLALLSVDSLADKGCCRQSPWFPVHTGLVFSFFLILLHSFYFFPSCFAACTLYYCWRMKKSLRSCLKTYLVSTTVSVTLAMILLLPTALTILETKKDVKVSLIREILSVNPSLNGLLYSPYGCGLTLICLYALFLSIRRRKTRVLASVLFVFLFFHVFCWILNGTLYIRPKSLIPFVPVLLFLTAQTLEELSRSKLRHSLPFALLCTIPVIVQIVFLRSEYRTLLLADAVILILYAAIGTLRQKNVLPGFRKCQSPFRTPAICLLFCGIPVLLFLETAGSESYVAAFTPSREVFSQKEIQNACTDTYARTDILESPLSNTNYTAFGTQNKTTLYSSVSNSAYNHLYYDILQMPVNIRNRVAMTGDVNPFQEYLLGVRYIQTTREKLPAGYTPLLKKGDRILAENKKVLPLAYGSTAVMDEAAFDRLTYPENLDTLTNRTIVPGAEDTSAAYRSQMKSYTLPQNFLDRNGTERETTLTKELPKPLKDEILLLSFHVDYHGTRDISVTINGIRNCLSGSDAPYPNRNTDFTYILSSSDTLTRLNIRFSKGDYRIRDLHAYTLPNAAISHPGLVPFSFEQTKGKELLHGTLSMEQEGYFVTSFAFSRGYRAYVDGKEVQPVKVNKAFVGFPIKKGVHEIAITFHAPGKLPGAVLTLLAFGYLMMGSLQPAPAPAYRLFPRH